MVASAFCHLHDTPPFAPGSMTFDWLAALTFCFVSRGTKGLPEVPVPLDQFQHQLWMISSDHLLATRCIPWLLHFAEFRRISSMVALRKMCCRLLHQELWPNIMEIDDDDQIMVSLCFCSYLSHCSFCLASPSTAILPASQVDGWLENKPKQNLKVKDQEPRQPLRRGGIFWCTKGTVFVVGD